MIFDHTYIHDFSRAVDINTHACLCTLQTLVKNEVFKCDVLAMDLVRFIHSKITMFSSIEVVSFFFCLQVGSLKERLAGKIDILVFNPPYVVTSSEEVRVMQSLTSYIE